MNLEIGNKIELKMNIDECIKYDVPPAWGVFYIRSISEKTVQIVASKRDIKKCVFYSATVPIGKIIKI